MEQLSDRGPFLEAGDIIIASDPKATRTVTFVWRNKDQNIEVLSRRDGPSGSLYTLREVREKPLGFRYLAEGESISELDENLAGKSFEDFSGLMDGSIADVVSRHAISAIRENELGAKA